MFCRYVKGYPFKRSRLLFFESAQSISFFIIFIIFFYPYIFLFCFNYSLFNSDLSSYPCFRVIFKKIKAPKIKVYYILALRVLVIFARFHLKFNSILLLRQCARYRLLSHGTSPEGYPISTCLMLPATTPNLSFSRLFEIELLVH